MDSRSNFWHRPNACWPAGPVWRSVHRDVSLSWGISAAASSAAAGVGRAVVEGVGDADRVVDAVGAGWLAGVLGSEPLVSGAVLGGLSADDEQPARAPLPTTRLTTRTARAGRIRVV